MDNVVIKVVILCFFVFFVIYKVIEVDVHANHVKHFKYWGQHEKESSGFRRVFFYSALYDVWWERIFLVISESWLWLAWLKSCVASKREEQKQLVSVSEWPDKQHQVPFKVNKDYVKLWIIQTYFLIAICFTWDSSPSNLCDSLLLDSTSCCCGLGPLSTISQHFIKAVWQSALMQLSMVHLCVTILQLWLETD